MSPIQYDEEPICRIGVGHVKRVEITLVTPVPEDGLDLQQYVELRDHVRKGQYGQTWESSKGVELPVWHLPELARAMIDALAKCDADKVNLSGEEIDTMIEQLDKEVRARYVQ